MIKSSICLSWANYTKVPNSSWSKRDVKCFFMGTNTQLTSDAIGGWIIIGHKLSFNLTGASNNFFQNIHCQWLLTEGKVHYGSSPRTNKFRSAPFLNWNFFFSFLTKQANLMRRSTVLSLPIS